MESVEFSLYVVFAPQALRPRILALERTKLFLDSLLTLAAVDAGKGFSVVATKVKSLANQTA